MIERELLRKHLNEVYRFGSEKYDDVPARIYNHKETELLFKIYQRIMPQIDYDYSSIYLSCDTDYHTNYSVKFYKGEEVEERLLSATKTFDKKRVNYREEYLISVYPLTEEEILEKAAAKKRGKYNQIIYKEDSLIDFGKYRGKSFTDLYSIDKSYFNWCATVTKNLSLKEVMTSIQRKKEYV